MKKPIISIVLLAATSFLLSSAVFAQGMMGRTNNTIDDHTAREETEGKVLWEALRTKQAMCADLSDKNFGALGEYFMGQMMGDSHEAMNAMMTQMMGEEGEEAMHIVMGKRLSGCDTSAAFPLQGIGFMPMMQMMMGGWSSPFGSNQTNNPTINFGHSPFGWFGWIFMVLLWVLIILGAIALIRWFLTQAKGREEEKSALTILKERYARGEIDKKEFEEKKKDLA